MFYFWKKHYKVHIILVILLVLYGILSPLFFLALSFVINEVIEVSSNNIFDSTFLIIWSLVAFFSMFFLPFVVYGFNRILAKIMFLISFDLRVKIINAIQTYSFLEFHKLGSDSFIGYLLNDVCLIEEKISRQFYALILFLSQIIFSLIFSIIIDYQNFVFFGFSLFTLIIFLVLPFLYKKYLSKATNNFLSQKNNFSKFANNFLLGYQTLFFANKLEEFSEMLAYSCLKIKKQEIIYSYKNNFQTTISSAISSILSTGVLIAGIFLAIQGFTTFGALVAASSLVNRVYDSASSIVDAFSDYLANKKLLTKDYKSTIFTKDSSLKNIGNIRKIEFNNVNLEIDNKKILNNFSFTFNENNKYAIIAKSGTGKSTLMRLILGVYKNYSGSIKINDIEVRDLKIQELLNQVSYLTNETFLFPGSVKNNICFFEEKIDQSKFDLSLIESQLKNEISPDDDSEQLSLGQKQRVILARMFYADKPLIFLDEATANLDKQNRNLIENRILSQKNKTVIMISHHLDENEKKLFNVIINL